MKWASWAARFFLSLVYLTALAAPWIAPAGYADQFRSHAGEPPSVQFPLGVDELGRDRLSRLLYGSRVSLLLAPAAAAVAVSLAFVIGLVAAVASPFLGQVLALSIDLLLSLPMLFLLLITRSIIPLNTGPWSSLLLMFALLGLLGWPAAARVIAASVRALMGSTFLLQARALGCSSTRQLATQLLPNLWPLVTAQFFLLMPMFILAEANLGILGLGVSEPLPSWGSMLAELTNDAAIRQTPVRLAPAVLMLMVVLSFFIIEDRQETPL